MIFWLLLLLVPPFLHPFIETFRKRIWNYYVWMGIYPIRMIKWSQTLDLIITGLITINHHVLFSWKFHILFLSIIKVKILIKNNSQTTRVQFSCPFYDILQEIIRNTFLPVGKGGNEVVSAFLTHSHTLKLVLTVSSYLLSFHLKQVLYDKFFFNNYGQIPVLVHIYGEANFIYSEYLISTCGLSLVMVCRTALIRFQNHHPLYSTHTAWWRVTGTLIDRKSVV